MFYFKLLVATKLKDYWGRLDLCSVSLGIIVDLQEGYKKHTMKLLLTRLLQTIWYHPHTSSHMKGTHTTWPVQGHHGRLC